LRSRLACAAGLGSIATIMRRSERGWDKEGDKEGDNQGDKEGDKEGDNPGDGFLFRIRINELRG